jgi:hypothetical protein
VITAQDFHAAIDETGVGRYRYVRFEHTDASVRAGYEAVGVKHRAGLSGDITPPAQAMQATASEREIAADEPFPKLIGRSVLVAAEHEADEIARGKPTGGCGRSSSSGAESVLGDRLGRCTPCGWVTVWRSEFDSGRGVEGSQIVHQIGR